jgi:hypothetical protein
VATQTEPRPSGAGRRFPARLQTFLRSATGRTSGPVVMALAATVPAIEFRVAAVLAGGAIVGLSYVAVQRHMRSLEDDNRRSVKDEVCEVLIHNINFLEHLKRVEGGLFRASVLLVDGQRQVLALKMCTHGFTDSEQDIVWAKGDGPPGMAWQLGRPIVAPKTQTNGWRAQQTQNMPLLCSADTNNANGAGDAALSPAQTKFLTGIGMMICYPIFDLHRTSKIVGVLTLDDRLAPGPHLEEVLSAAEFLRDEVRRRLAMGRTPSVGALAGDG